MLQRLKKIEKYLREQHYVDFEARKLMEMSKEELEQSYNECLQEHYDAYGISTVEDQENYKYLLSKWVDSRKGEEVYNEIISFQNEMLIRKNQLESQLK